MFLLTSIAFLTGLFGFAFPPFWIVTFFALRAIVRTGRANHAIAHQKAEDARMKMYLSWSK